MYLHDYERICGNFDVDIGEENEDGILKSYIYTNRFCAESLHTTEKNFANFSDQIKQLFNITFADPAVMSQYTPIRDKNLSILIPNWL